MGSILMVSSGKGGTGKSTFSVFAGEALANRENKVLVVELDCGLRSVDVISGVYGKAVYDIEDVLTGRCEPTKAIVHSPRCDNLCILCAPYNSDVIPLDNFVQLIAALSQPFDYIIIDTAAGIGSAFYAATAVAMRAIVIATPDPVSVRDARIVVDRLHEQSINDIRLVINRLMPDTVKRGVVPNLDYCIDNIGARLIGLIPESTEISLASSRGESLSGKSVEYQVFDNIAQRLLGDDVPLAIF